MKRKQSLQTYKAKVKLFDGKWFAQLSTGQLWCLPEINGINPGDTILVSIPDQQNFNCNFIRLAPELI